jgi:hypothetical protein
MLKSRKQQLPGGSENSYYNSFDDQNRDKKTTGLRRYAVLGVILISIAIVAFLTTHSFNRNESTINPFNEVQEIIETDGNTESSSTVEGLSISTLIPNPQDMPSEELVKENDANEQVSKKFDEPQKSKVDVIAEEKEKCEELIQQARIMKSSLRRTDEYMETNDDAKKLVADLQNHLRNLFKLKYGNDIKTFKGSLRIKHLNFIIIRIPTFS